MSTPPGGGLEHRASNPVSVKNLTAIETSTTVKLLRPYVPVGTKRTGKFSPIEQLLVNQPLHLAENAELFTTSNGLVHHITH
jgi:hypothetical protein